MTLYKTSEAQRARSRAYYYAHHEERKAKMRAASKLRARGLREASEHQTELNEYEIWCSMKARCYNPNSISFPRYGGRGIKVCDAWRRSFKQFYADVGSRPSPKHSLDRIDNDGNYEPGNMRWATKKQQGANTRRRIDNTSGYRGVSRNYKGWSASIITDGVTFHIGTFPTREEAAWMRDQYALVLHGEFARLNFDYVPVDNVLL